MKAFKQISYTYENKIVFGYAGIMSLLSFFILLSPVLAQDDEPVLPDQPNVHYDVKKEYDKDGNLTGYDSAMIWYWSGEGAAMYNFDSLFEQFDKQFDFFNDQWNWSGLDSFPSIPFPFNDSLGISFYNFDDLSKYFDEEFNGTKHFDDFESLKELHGQHDEFMERFEEYQKEHQKLIEKYFGKPEQLNGIKEPKSEPQKLKSPEAPVEQNKSGTI
jgi:hypothetical protein